MLTFGVFVLHLSIGLMLEMSALESLYSGQITLSTPLTKPNIFSNAFFLNEELRVIPK